MATVKTIIFPTLFFSITMFFVNKNAYSPFNNTLPSKQLIDRPIHANSLSRSTYLDVSTYQLFRC